MRSPITAKGALRLRAELDELKSVKRPKVIAEIAEARSHADEIIVEPHGAVPEDADPSEGEDSWAPLLGANDADAREIVSRVPLREEAREQPLDERMRKVQVGDARAQLRRGVEDHG